MLAVLAFLAGAVGSLSLAPSPAVAKQGWTLTGVCTPVEFYPEFRRFLVINDTGQGSDVELRNPSVGQSVFVFAPPGESVHLVPAKATGSNLTQLWVNGKNMDVDQAVNVACAVLSGRAVCVPERGEFDMTWTVTNNDTTSRPIVAVAPRPVAFAPNPVPGHGGAAVGRETLPAPDVGTREVSLTVEVDLGDESTTMSERLVLGECQEPIPPEISFSFDKDASVTEAAVGDTVTYTYSGRNTGEVPLEVTQLVDDDLGVLISDPSVETIVAPGESIRRQVDYVVTAADAVAGSIDNAAVVTLHATQGPDQAEKSATATESVRVVQPPETVLTGSAVCNPNAPAYEVTWTLHNTGRLPFTVTGTAPRAVEFSPATVPSGGTATAIETRVPSSRTETLPLTVTLANEFGDTTQVTAEVELGVCEPPMVDFTFIKTADRPLAGLGDTITYTYSGTNTGDVPLEVTQLVDDRLGVVISDPGTIVAPGDSISTEVQYTVIAADVAVGAIDNTAVLTARATEGPDQTERSAIAEAHVDVVQPPAPIVAALAGTAVCDLTTGDFDVTWTLTNGGDNLLTVLATAPRDVVFQPRSVPSGGQATGEEQITPPTAVGELDLGVTVDDVDQPATEPVQVTATAVFGRCEPPLPSIINFTFTKTADRDVSRIGQTITYSYAGTNTGDVPLEVTQLVDDHLSVLLRRPVVTVVQPGESISERVTYTTTALDASAGVIRNAAVVNVLPVGLTTKISAVALADVRVVPPPIVEEPPLSPDRPAQPPNPPGEQPPTNPPLPNVGGPSEQLAILGAIAALTGTLLLIGFQRPRSKRDASKA
jgi:uncharacterized repeat protein (TIGR01451 family)